MKIRSLLGFSIVVVMLISSFSCKKAAEEQANDIVKKLMVEGTWRVTAFTENSTNVTASFSGWVFKFNDNNTVTATQGSTVQTGTWQSNVTAQTIGAQFPSSAGNPVIKLNGTWNIANSTLTIGNFTQTTGGVAYTMELTKN